MKNKIKEILKDKGITQKELCSITGISEAGMSYAVNKGANIGTIKKIADALNIDQSELIDDMPYAKYSSDKTPLKLGNIELPCYVLNNGMRVFSGRGMQRALGNSVSSGQWIQRFANNKDISDFYPSGIIDKFNTPIKFKRNDAGGSQIATYGYEATLLIDLCNAIIDAYNVRRDIDVKYFNAANIIIRSVAKVGIIALVDEATGYNKEKNRAKDELQKFLKTFINEEASKWVKTFDDTFFEDIYKMRNWTWAETSKRPAFVGKIINDIVYERIAPYVLEKLNEKNPKNENGIRKYKFHQFLTSDIGKPALQNHLLVLHTLAVVSDYNWIRFMEMLDKSHPKQNQQLQLIEEELEIG